MAERIKKRQQQLIDDHATAAVLHGRDGDPIATPIESERGRERECASERARQPQSEAYRDARGRV
jgi:hypothetical protein